MKQIKDLIAGEKLDLFAVVKLAKNKKTKQTPAKSYIDFVFEDLTGSIDAKYWDKTLEMIGGEGTYPSGCAVKVRAVVNEWQGKKQLAIEQIRPINESDGVTKEDFIKKAPISTEIMYTEILDIVNKFETEDLKKISLAVIEMYKVKLMYYPASLVVHHNIKAGLLYHEYCMIKGGLKMAEVYSFNTELLITGILIHDIGKIDEIDSNEDGIAVDYTREGKLLGHMVQGSEVIHDLSRELGVNKEVELLLKHMIASHHGIPEHGAVKKPAFFEAELLHSLDMIDSRHYMYAHATENIEDESFSEKVFYLDNKQVYRHNI